MRLVVLFCLELSLILECGVLLLISSEILIVELSSNKDLIASNYSLSNIDSVNWSEQIAWPGDIPLIDIDAVIIEKLSNSITSSLKL